MFYAAAGIQILQCCLSFFLGSDTWLLQALFWIWLALVPFIGFFAGREGDSLGKSGGLAALLFVSWFLLVSSNTTFLSLTSAWYTDKWLRGMGAFGLANALLALAVILVAVVAALIGRRFLVQSSA